VNKIVNFYYDFSKDYINNNILLVGSVKFAPDNAKKLNKNAGFTADNFKKRY